MGGLQSRDVEYMLLRIIDRQTEPVGAGFLADILQGEQDAATSEATIGRYLRKFEKWKKRAGTRSEGPEVFAAGSCRRSA